MKKILLLSMLLPGIVIAQKKGPPRNPNIIAAPCNFPGTTPTTAIPVCGIKVFPQTKFINCDDGLINQNACVGDAFGSRFAFWYKFTCFSAGDLEFLITPSSSFDIDWALFDVTGHVPNDVLATPPPANPCLPISLNGTGNTGVTGCRLPEGISNVVCYGGGNRFNRPEPLTVGHKYLLMVQNYSESDTTSYTLAFGGTAGITDGALPALDHIDGGCTSFKVFFSTDVKCSSVTSSGSELTINPGGIKPVSVTSVCGTGSVATTSLTVNLVAPLIPGNYTLTIDNGTDANTYTNVCDNAIATGTTMDFTVTQPIGNFTLPPETCRGTATNFVSSSDPLPGNIVTEWHWDFGDPSSGAANTSDLQSPSHTFTAAGSFLVRHWIVNSLGCNSDTSSQLVSIIPLHNIVLGGGIPSQAVCINNAITPFLLNISGGASGILPALNLPAGVTATLVGNTVTIAGTPTVAGVFGYSVTTTGNSCAPDTYTGTITVTGDATLTRTSLAGSDAQELCKNSPINNITYDFGGTATGATVTGLPAGVTWSITGNTITITGSPTVSSPATFNYTVSTLGPCIKPSLGGTILVNALPTAAFSFVPPSCETRVISFTDGSAANIGALDQWTWDFGDGSPTSALQNPTHVYVAAGAYTVTLTVRNDKGCISNPVSSSIINIENRPKAGFIIPEVCLNDSYAQFIDTSSLQNAAINRWEWNFGDPGSGVLNTSNLQNPTHSYSALTSYNVRLIVWNNVKGCRDTIIQTLVINGSFPVAGFNVSNPTALCANEPVNIAESSTVFPGSIAKVEIYWDNVNASTVFDTDNTPFTGKIYSHLYPNFQSPLIKTFTIRYRAYSGGVCVNDKLQSITVHAAPLVQFDNIPDTCLLVSPFQLTQATQIGAVSGTGVYNGPGISPGGIFDPQAAGVGTHTITYTFTSSPGGCVDFKSKTITVLDTSHAAFSFISPSCELLPTSFTDLSTAPANNTIWNFGDLLPVESHAPGSTFGHLFPAPGTYTVTMYNESAAGCRSTVTTKQVTIDPNHSLSLTTANNIQIHCINTSIVPIKYKLAGGATNVIISNLPPGVTYTVVADTVTISGTVTSTLNSPYTFNIQTTGNTCVVANAIGKITVEPDHTIAFTSGLTTQSVCVNTPIIPIVYAIGGGANDVIISNLPPGIGYIVSGSTVTISGSPTSTSGGPLFHYDIQTTGNSCVKAFAAGEIRVNPYPVPNFALDKPGYCIPNAIVKFNNTSAMPDLTQMTYSWNFGEPASGFNNTSTLLHPSHWYSTTGPFNVKLAARSMAILNGNAIGCLHDTTIAITTIHPQPVADFYQSQPSACLDDVVTFTDRTNQNTGVTTEWHWDMGDGNTPDQISFTHVYADTLEYNIRYFTVNMHGCNSDTINRLFKVYPNPTVYAGEDRMILQDIKITLAPVATGADLQYVWSPNLYFLNGNNTLKNPTAIGIKDDITYKLTVTSRGGCKRDDDVYIKILKPPVIPNTFSPNGDRVNEKWLISYLNDYPDCRVEVFTRAGQLVFRSVKGYGVAWDGKRNGKPLPFDTYYYVIEPGYGRDPITGYVTLLK